MNIQSKWLYKMRQVRIDNTAIYSINLSWLLNLAVEFEKKNEIQFVRAFVSAFKLDVKQCQFIKSQRFKCICFACFVLAYM